MLKSTSFRRLRPALALALALAGAGLAITGCASQNSTVIQQPTFIATYDTGMLGYSASRGGMLVETIGNPFSLPDRPFKQKVAAMMEGAQSGPRMPFFATPPETFSSPYKLRVSLNTTITSQSICRAESATETPAGASAPPLRIDAIVAFCIGDRRISSTRGHVGNVIGPDDPKLRSLLRSMTKLVLPAVDPNRIGNGRDHRRWRY